MNAVMRLPCALYLVHILLVSCADRASSGTQQSSNVNGNEVSHRIVFRDENGRELTFDDLRNVTGKVNYEVIGRGQVPQQAHELHQRARKAGQAGNYQRALSLLDSASSLAPDWPYPIYDAAFTHLLMKNFDKALEDYRAVDRLAPRGFFTAKTAIDVLQKEAEGKFPRGLYLDYLRLEWINDEATKSEAIKKLVAAHPKFAPAWKEYALLCEDAEKKMEAIDKGLEAEPDPETRGLLLINKALALHSQGKRDVAIRMLGELCLSQDSTLGTQQIAKVSLASVLHEE